MVSKSQEVYIGNEEDREFIGSYLSLLRGLTPNEMFLLSDVCPLSERIADSGLIEASLFNDIVRRVLDAFRAEYDGGAEVISPERYFLGKPSSKDRLGGFHSPHSAGYHDMYRASFTVLPNSKAIKNITIRTLEVCRCYLHDSLHHSTFCSYRRFHRKPMTARDAKHLLPGIFRFQYGINYRNAAGMSYSSHGLTYKAPYAINLNLLMDGAIVLTIAQLMSRVSPQVKRSSLSRAEKMMIDDIMLASNYRQPGIYGEEFYFRVTDPTQRFLEYWGGDHIRRLVLRAMLSGELGELVSYFEERFGEHGAWERVFRQPGFDFGLESA